MLLNKLYFRVLGPSLTGIIVSIFLNACSSGSGGSDPMQTEFGDARVLSSAVNSASLDAGPDISDDDLSLYFHSDRAGGEGALDIWMSSRASTSSPWENAVNLGATINSSSDDRAPTISSDGLTLIFVSNRSGDNDIYQSSRASVNDPWSAPASIGVNINTLNDESGPSLSEDGLTLLFHSGSLGNPDIYMSTRVSTADPWETPVNLGSVVNSTEFDVAPDISADGLTLYFHSSRSGGLGSYNIWVSTRMSTLDAWSAPTVMDSPVNSTAIETGPSISADGRTLYFASTRTGSAVRDIWQVSR